MSGGYTDIFVTGVVGPVVYADVESLYPSIMLHYDVRPHADDEEEVAEPYEKVYITVTFAQLPLKTGSGRRRPGEERWCGRSSLRAGRRPLR